MSRHLNVRLLTTAIATVGVLGCNLNKQEAPALTGPSTLGQYVEVTVSPDRMLYDGTSQAVATATIHGPDGKPLANVSVRWQADVVTVNNGTMTPISVPVEPSPQLSATGTNGATSTVVRAPIAPDTMPAGDVMLRVTATPIGNDASQLAPGVDAKPRTALVQLVPLDGASAPDRLPVPDFTMSPPSANIFQSVTFDGSLSRDEGVVCGDRCTYVWEFSLGGGLPHSTRNGRVTETSFESSGAWKVTLYVTDERGFTGTKSQTLNISAPAAPLANFFVSPAAPRVGAAATFDASTTTVGQGVSIVSYIWDFGDGSPNGAGKTTTHTYAAVPTAPATGYNVTLTVTDDLGRISQKTLQVGVLP